jgi:Zn-finger nucleic acid-binding protein
MKCPHCPDTDLAMTSREGIEIDYCPQCRGVWLDRGELDKIIERSETTPIQREEYRPSPGYPQGGGDYYRGKRKKSLLKELLDF